MEKEIGFAPFERCTTKVQLTAAGSNYLARVKSILKLYDKNELRNCAPLFFELGDCVEPKNVYTANATAYTIARDIGRY